MGVGVGGAVAGRLEARAGADEVGHHRGAGVRVGRRGGGVVVVDGRRSCRRLGQARVRRDRPGAAGPRRSCPRRGGRGRRRRAGWSTPARCGLRRRRRAAARGPRRSPCSGGCGCWRSRVSAVRPWPQVTSASAPSPDERRAPGRRWRTPRCATSSAAGSHAISAPPPGRSVNRAGTDGWPVWPTCMGWPLPQLAVPQNTHSSGPPTMSIDAQNRGPMPV